MNEYEEHRRPYEYIYTAPFYIILLFRISKYNIIMILHSYVEQVITICCVIRMATFAVILSELFPLIISDAISCPLYKLNTFWNISMILHSYVGQVMSICHVQMTTFAFTLSGLFSLAI